MDAVKLVGEQLGRYRILSLLGQGGMGVVYLAEDETLRRQVALKVLPPSYAGQEERRRRLLREARAVAALNHPNLVSLHDVGEADGQVYIAMELVRGKSLAALLDERQMPVPEALAVAGQILRGLGKAHEAGFVHRDLKPDNVMITREGGVKILDFGLAKRREQDSSASDLGEAKTVTIVTEEGRVLGTPSYMSPEQARGVAVDLRSDIFSFGVLLYEMLAGQRPFRGSTTADVITAILRDDPPPVLTLNSEVPSELSRIVARCLAKAPDGRYDDCQSLGAELERALEAGAGEAPSPEPLAARRLPRAAWAFAMVAGIALVGAGAAFLRPKTPSAEPAPAATVLDAEKTEAELRATGARNASRMAAARERKGDPTTALALLRELEPGPVPQGWDELARAAGYAGVALSVFPHEGAVLSAAFSPDGQRIVSASNDKTVRIWNADGTGQPLVLRGHEGAVVSAAFSPDGRRVVSASDDKTVRIWSADGTGQPLVLRGHDDGISSAAFSPDGQRVVSASDDKTLRIWSADGTGQPLVLRGHSRAVAGVAFSPDGRRVVSASDDKTLRIWSADGTGQPLILRGHDKGIRSAAFSPDGRRVVSASDDKTLRIWSADGTGQPLVLSGHDDRVHGAAFSPDSRRIVSTSYDKTVRVWSADGTGQPLVLRGHDEGIRSAAFSPDGRRVVSASFDKTVRVWNVDGTDQPLVLQGHRDQVFSAAWSPDGRRIASASGDRTVRLWNPDGTSQPLVLRGHENAVVAAAWSPDGRRVASASRDKTGRVWSADGAGQPLVLRGHDEAVVGVSWSPDGRRIVSASFDKTARVWNADGTGQPIVLLGHGDQVWSAAFSPDGRRVVSASGDKTVRVWNADGTGEPLVLRGHEGPVIAAAFSSDGRRITSASADKTVRVWNADGTGEPLVRRGHEAMARLHGDSPFSPDGARIVSTSPESTSTDAAVRIWNADGTGEPVVLRWSDNKAFSSASWSPPYGRRVVAASDDKTLVVWNDVEPLRDAENPRLWAATTYCMPLEVRKRLLDFPEEQSRADLERCERHVREAQPPSARGR